MTDPRSAKSSGDCLAIARACAGNYPLCLGWQTCLEPLLPPLFEAQDALGRTYDRCLAFLVDEELGPHFVFDGEGGLKDVQLSDVQFAEPLSEEARRWLRALRDWLSERLSHPPARHLRLL